MSQPAAPTLLSAHPSYQTSPQWTGTARGYLNAALVPPRVAVPPPPKPPAAALRPSGWPRGARLAARLALVAGTLVVAVAAPLSQAAERSDATSASSSLSTWPAAGGAGENTGIGATTGAGVRLAAASSATPKAKVLTTYGGGGLTAIPSTVYAAYQAAANQTDGQFPKCNLSWSVLAGIGEIESDHAKSGGSLDAGWDGVAKPPILGPVLDGTNGNALVRDTDGGRLDGNREFDRAVGPMQFLPSTWTSYGVDADGDGVANPEDVNDAAEATGHYLCAGNLDLSNPVQLAQTIDRYNHAEWYVRAVMAASAGYLAESFGRSQQGVALAAIAFGYAHLGDPYEFGGTGPYYDCSGLTQAAYVSAGIKLPRTSEDQWLALPHVDGSQIQPGDLLFFNPGEFRRGLPGHVGIYLGDGYMLDDPHTGAFVRIEPIAGFGQLFGAARPATLVPAAGSPTPGSGLVISVAPPPVTLPATIVTTPPSTGALPAPRPTGPVLPSLPVVPGTGSPQRGPVTTTPTIPAAPGGSGGQAPGAPDPVLSTDPSTPTDGGSNASSGPTPGDGSGDPTSSGDPTDSGDPAGTADPTDSGGSATDTPSDPAAGDSGQPTDDSGGAAAVFGDGTGG